MLQRLQFATLLALCLGLALSFPAAAQVERNQGSRSRSNPGGSRTVGVDIPEDLEVAVLISTAPPVGISTGFLGSAWLAQSIAQSMMQAALETAKQPLPAMSNQPGLVIEEDPKPEFRPTRVEGEVDVDTTPAVQLTPAPDLKPATKFSMPEPTKVGIIDQVIEDTASDRDPVGIKDEQAIDETPEVESDDDPDQPEIETPSKFDVRQGQETEAARNALDSSMPVLSELMAKLDKLDPPAGEQSAESADESRKWRNPKDGKEEDQPLELNSSDGLTFRIPRDEVLQSPGHGTEVDYPKNPNTNLVDGEIARFAPELGSGGQESPRLLAMATLQTDGKFEQAMVMLPVSKTGLGAMTTSVRAGDPGNMTIRASQLSMPHPQVSPRIRSLSSGNPKQMKVALTFDDGPHPEYTNQILAILDHYNVDATFFFVGIQAAKHPQWVKMTNQAGHEIASQTYDHFRMPKLPLEEKRYQIDEYQRLIEDLVGITPRFMRPPGGQLDETTKRLLVERGMVLGLWDVALNDTGIGKTTAQMMVTTKAQVKPGSVLLVHDGIQATIDVLPELIEYLHAQGYEFVTMSELAQGL